MTPLLAVEVDNNAIMVGVVGALGILLGLYSKARALEKSIRTGDKIELKQPVDVEIKERPMTVPMHEAACGPLHQRVSVLERDVRFIRAKMETDKQEIIGAGETRVVELHRRINGIPHEVIALLKDTKGLI